MCVGFAHGQLIRSMEVEQESHTVIYGNFSVFIEEIVGGLQ